MSPPANIIIGEVVKLHKIIGWKKWVKKKL
jgi:hypothetical protein